MKALRVASYPLIACWLILGLFAAAPAVAGIGAHWRDYLWFAGGSAAYTGLRQLSIFSKNDGWTQVFSH